MLDITARSQVFQFSGIGAQIGLEDGLPVIIAPFDGSPAEAAGIRAGDIIIEMDGVDVTTWPLNDIVENIRGEAGSQVETTFGTGTVLRPFSLDDGSALMLGASQWLTPDGRLIRKQGIQPDVTVELPIDAQLLSPGVVEGLTTEELLESEDTQLLKALELLDALPEA